MSGAARTNQPGAPAGASGGTAIDAFIIHGGRALSGALRVNGSKNAALPEMAAALLTDEPLTLRGVPALADIRSMRRLLDEMGCAAEEAPGEREGASRAGGGPLTIRTVDPTPTHARYEIVKTMRASVCVLGPTLARRGRARVSMPGGCAIGDRPIDLHLRGLAALGAEVTLEAGDVVVEAPRSAGAARRLHGARVFLGGPFGSTVLGTANVMSAAALAKGQTIIECAACEPEVVDLANLLNAMGARIEGAGSPRIVIEGVEALGGAEHEVIPDRIEAGTFMIAAAITGGRLRLSNCPLDALMAAVDRLEEAGVRVAPVGRGGDPMRATCDVSAAAPLRPVRVTTQPHPGFPTDLQAQMMALLAVADGHSVITEKIFPDRFLHVAELARMGAQLFRQGPTVVVSGVTRLVGAPVMASDLRASAGLVLAGLVAQGETIVLRVYHLDRGYERMEEAMRSVGASIERVEDKDLSLSTTAVAEA